MAESTGSVGSITFAKSLGCDESSDSYLKMAQSSRRLGSDENSDLYLKMGQSNRRLARGATMYGGLQRKGSSKSNSPLPRGDTFIKFLEEEDDSLQSMSDEERSRSRGCSGCDEIYKKKATLEEALKTQNATLAKQRSEIAALREMLEGKLTKSSWFKSSSKGESKTVLLAEIEVLKRTNEDLKRQIAESGLGALP